MVLRRSLETSQWEMQGIRLVLAVLLSVVILQLQPASGSLEFTWRNERAVAHPPLSANALLEEANHFVKVLSYTIYYVSHEVTTAPGNQLMAEISYIAI